MSHPLVAEAERMIDDEYIKAHYPLHFNLLKVSLKKSGKIILVKKI